MNSRFKNSVRNSLWATCTNIITILLNFLVRTIFIKKMSNDYLGINGLFTNILYVLSFAELGVGHAITYFMYKPFSLNDFDKLKSLLKLYKKYYYIIGFLILLIGIILIPFFPIIIKDVPVINESLILIYLLYLFETSFSYFFTYKKSMLIVSQKDYIYDIVKSIFQIIKSILQILILVFIKSYILYLIVFVFSTLIANVITGKIVDKIYPFVKDNSLNLSNEEKNKITENIKALILHKLGRVSLSGTDNIIISSLIGITTVGMYSNYSLIISTVSGIVYLILKGSISSIGSFNVTESVEKKQQLMNQLLFISAWIYGFTVICLMILIDPFIILWIGNEYLISNLAISASLFYILIDGLEFSTHTFISTLGYFKETKYSSLICAVMNIVLSIVLGLNLGLFGIFISTAISKLLTTFWFEPYVIYKKEFNKSPKEYYLKYIKLLICIFVNYFICHYVVNFITIDSINGFILKCLITVILCNLIFIFMFFKTKEFNNIINRIRGYYAKNEFKRDTKCRT